MAILSLRTKFGYGVGHIFNDLCSSLWFTYLLIFFHNVERFPNTLAGVLLLIGQIADAVSTPFVGHQADRPDDTQFCVHYGRRKTWHLVGSLCVIVAFPFIFMGCLGCDLSESLYQVIYFAPFVVIFQFGWAAVQISHLALIPHLTPDANERTGLNAIRYGATVSSNIAVYLITWLVLGIGASSSVIGPADATVFKIIVAAVVCLGAFFSIIFHIAVREENPAFIDDYDQPLSSDLTSSTSQSSYRPISSDRPMNSSDWFKVKQFYVVGIVYMCTRLFCNISQAYVPIYLQETLALKPESVAYIPLTMYVAGFITTIVIKPLNRKLGRKFTYSLGSLFGLAACMWVYFGEGEVYSKYLVYVVAVLFGAGSSTILITSLSVTADLIGNNTESGAFVYGAMSFTDKLSNGVAIMIIQYYSPYSPLCPHCLEYYRYVLAFVCGAVCIIGTFAVTFTRDGASEAQLANASFETEPLMIAADAPDQSRSKAFPRNYNSIGQSSNSLTSSVAEA